MSHRTVRVALQLLALLAGLGLLALSQSGNGTINGRMLDASGAVVPNVTVKAVNQETGLVTSTVSTGSGEYLLVQLRPGIYTLEAEQSGFKKISRKDVQVRVSDKITIDLTLEVGQTSESVTVAAEAPMLRTQDAQTGEVINTNMIQSLPQINRDPLQLLQLAGNVSGTGTAGGGSDLRINGGRTSSVDYIVDGGSILSGRRHDVRTSFIPMMEEVSEFKVITNGISAEYGRVSGGLVEIATRGGTNEIHGQALWFFRNQLLNANSWEQNANAEYVPGKKAERTQFHQNTFGGQVGGPLYIPKLYNGKNKTFWMFNYEGLRYSEAGVLKINPVPTMAEREGDMTGTLMAGASPFMWDPLGNIVYDDQGRPSKATPMGGDGMHIPKSRISEITRRMLEVMPQPNRAPVPGYTQFNNFAGASGFVRERNYWGVRMDQNFTEKHRLMGRFTRNKMDETNSQWYHDYDPGWVFKNKGSLVGNVNYDWMISPTLIFSARASANYEPNYNGQDWQNFSNADWPFDSSMKALMVQDRLPFRVIVQSGEGCCGWEGYGLNNTWAPHYNTLTYTNYGANAAITKIFNKHTVKAGFDNKKFYDNFLESGLGWMYFGGTALTKTNYDNMYSDPAPYFQKRANSWGSYLLGTLDFAQQSAPWTMALGFNYYASYIQDDWRVNSKLTLNLGLRWEMETPVTERHDKLTGFDPSGSSWFKINPGWNWATELGKAGLSSAQIGSIPEPGWSKTGQFPNGRLVVPNTPEYPSRKMGMYNWKHFAPRIGMAYQLDSKTVLRASLNMMHMSATGDYYGMWASVVPSTSGATCYMCDREPTTGNPRTTWDHVFTGKQLAYYKRTTAEANWTMPGNLGGPAWNIRGDTPYEWAWNFGLQRQVKGFVLEAMYNGNRSTTLLVQENLTPMPANLIDPKYSDILAKRATSPVAGQVQEQNYNSNPMRVGVLVTDNPARGTLTYNGYNGGKSFYNGINLRAERRMAAGMAFLANYTYSVSKDNVGGPETSFWGQGVGSKYTYSHQTFRDIYGLSPLDQSHRFAFYHDVQFPFGKGRKFLGNPSSAGEKIVDGIVGGWGFAGQGVWNSGRPVIFGVNNGNLSDGQGVGSVAGYLLSNPDNSLFSENSQVLRGPRDSAPAVSRFEPKSFALAKPMTIGNMPPIWGAIRHPGNFGYDVSLMKRFNMFSERNYLLFRVEAENVFNIRGYAGYNTTFGDPNFGYITSSRQNPRRMQLSAKIYF